MQGLDDQKGDSVTNPSSQQMREFWTQVQNGSITRKCLQAFLDNPRISLTEADTTSILTTRITSENPPFFIDHPPLDTDGLTTDNEVKLRVLEFRDIFKPNEMFGIKEFPEPVLKRLAQIGHEPAEYEYLAVFIEEVPKILKYRHIVALGSSVTDSRGNKYYPVASQDDQNIVIDYYKWNISSYPPGLCILTKDTN